MNCCTRSFVCIISSLAEIKLWSKKKHTWKLFEFSSMGYALWQLNFVSNQWLNVLSQQKTTEQEIADSIQAMAGIQYSGKWRSWLCPGSNYNFTCLGWLCRNGSPQGEVKILPSNNHYLHAKYTDIQVNCIFFICYSNILIIFM